MARRTTPLLIGALVFALALTIGGLSGGGGSDPIDLTLDELRTNLEAGTVESAVLRQDADIVEGTLTTPVDGATEFRTAYSDGFEGALTEELLEAGVSTTVERDGVSATGVILNLLPLLLMIGLGVFFYVRLTRSRGGNGGGLLSIGRSRATDVTHDRPSVNFGDVAGLDEVIEELEEVTDFLEKPERFTAMGAKIPKGVLLAGPPGTGKTLLAKAVAGEAGVPFLTISGSDFVEMFVGVGASRVRDLFRKAKELAPVILFIDEIDAVGRHRGAGLGGGNDEREQTLNQLLVEMDGFGTTSGVIVIAATNRADVLDPALLRPGRFDRQIVVDRPDLLGRIAILGVHTRGKPMGSDVDLEVLARRTPGFTGADLANALNEGALLATRRGRTEVTAEDLEDAVDKVVAGPERRSRILSEQERKVVAYHEAGHALVGWALPCADPIHKVTIIPRGRALGFTQALPTEDRYLMHRSELTNQIAMLAGGRAAEELVFADPTTGASNDLDKATRIARQMVTTHGMSDRLGFVRISGGDEPFLGRELARRKEMADATAATVDNEISALLEAGLSEALDIVAAHRGALDRLADALVERETLDADAVAEVLADVPKWSQPVVVDLANKSRLTG